MSHLLAFASRLSAWSDTDKCPSTVEADLHDHVPLPCVSTSAGIVEPAIRWRRVSRCASRCFFTSISVASLLSSDAVTAAAPPRRLWAIVQHSVRGLADATHTDQASSGHHRVRPTSRCKSACSNRAETAAHWAPSEPRATRRLVRQLQASKETGAVAPVRTFGCAAMINGPLVEAPSGRFAHAAAGAVNQTDEEGHGHSAYSQILSTFPFTHELLETEETAATGRRGFALKKIRCDRQKKRVSL